MSRIGHGRVPSTDLYPWQSIRLPPRMAINCHFFPFLSFFGILYLGVLFLSFPSISIPGSQHSHRDVKTIKRFKNSECPPDIRQRSCYASSGHIHQFDTTMLYFVGELSVVLSQPALPPLHTLLSYIMQMADEVIGSRSAASLDISFGQSPDCGAKQRVAHSYLPPVIVAVLIPVLGMKLRTRIGS